MSGIKLNPKISRNVPPDYINKTKWSKLFMNAPLGLRTLRQQAKAPETLPLPLLLLLLQVFSTFVHGTRGKRKGNAGENRIQSSHDVLNLINEHIHITYIYYTSRLCM